MIASMITNRRARNFPADSCQARAKPSGLAADHTGRQQKQ